MMRKIALKLLQNRGNICVESAVCLTSIQNKHELDFRFMIEYVQERHSQ